MFRRTISLHLEWDYLCHLLRFNAPGAAILFYFLIYSSVKLNLFNKISIKNYQLSKEMKKIIVIINSYRFYWQFLNNHVKQNWFLFIRNVPPGTSTTIPDHGLANVYENVNVDQGNMVIPIVDWAAGPAHAHSLIPTINSPGLALWTLMAMSFAIVFQGKYLWDLNYPYN